jgi:hypothetical protein
MWSRSPASFTTPSVISLVIDEQAPRVVIEIRARLDRLIDQGRELLGLAGDARITNGFGAGRAWQTECAAVINELSGGSKAHWLSRAYSQAFLVRTGSTGSSGLPTEVPVTEIAGRLVAVLEQARSSLAAWPLESSSPEQTASSDPNVKGALSIPQAASTAVRRFDFVRDSRLRPILETSYVESRRALEERRFLTAFLTSCSILEAVITDALHAAPAADFVETDEPIAEWSFDRRLRAAERAGIIGGGCARLPLPARGYRESSGGETTVSERDARLVGQVLNVVLRDLDPGR